MSDLKKASDVVARKIRESIMASFDPFDMVGFWELVDGTIKEILEDQGSQPAQIWLANDGNDVVCISMLGADDPTLLPFFVPKPNIPVRADAVEQIKECADNISCLRRFARELMEMADDAEMNMRSITGK